jgi:predicted Zn-dependent protease
MWIETNSNLEEAGTLIRKALQANPDSPYYRDTFGWWLFKMGEPKAALDELVRALKRMPTPEQPDVHSHLAEVYWSLNDPVNTARHLKAFAEMRPDTPGLEERIETLRIANPEIR